MLLEKNNIAESEIFLYSKKVKPTPVTATLRDLIEYFLFAEDNKKEYEELEELLEDYIWVATNVSPKVSNTIKTLDDLTKNEFEEMHGKLKDVFKIYDEIKKIPEVNRPQETVADLRKKLREVLKEYGVTYTKYDRMIEDMHDRISHRKKIKKTKVVDKKHLKEKQFIQQDEDNRCYLGLLKAAIKILFEKEKDGEHLLSNIKELYPEHTSNLKKEDVDLPKLIKKIRTNYMKGSSNKIKRLFINMEKGIYSYRSSLYDKLSALSKDKAQKLIKQVFDGFTERYPNMSYHLFIKEVYVPRESKIKKDIYKLINYGLKGLTEKIMVIEDRADISGRKIMELKRLHKDAEKGINYDGLTKKYNFINKRNMHEALKIYKTQIPLLMLRLSLCLNKRAEEIREGETYTKN